MFLEHQILEWFLMDHVSDDWNNDAENPALPLEEINYIWKYIKTENSYFKM